VVTASARNNPTVIHTRVHEIKDWDPSRRSYPSHPELDSNEIVTELDEELVVRTVNNLSSSHPSAAQQAFLDYFPLGDLPRPLGHGVHWPRAWVDLYSYRFSLLPTYEQPLEPGAAKIR
jgi:hypothetical protein